MNEEYYLRNLKNIREKYCSGRREEHMGGMPRRVTAEIGGNRRDGSLMDRREAVWKSEKGCFYEREGRYAVLDV